jgi:Large polyvalent protein associated domain 29
MKKTMQSVKTYNAVQAAKFVRKELKGSIPQVKFSVTSSHHTVSISWVNGPTRKQVEEVSRKFGGMTFDGMDDGTKYSQSTIDGESVQFYCYKPDTKRHLTLEFAHKLLARVQEKHPGMLCLEIKVSDFSGYAYFDRMSSQLSFDQENYFLEAINSISEDELNKPVQKEVWQIDIAEFLRDRAYLAKNNPPQSVQPTKSTRPLYLVK